MPTLARNHRQIMAAKAVGRKRTRYYIEGVRGLLLDVTPNGARTWYVRYQLRRGTRRLDRSYKIGNASHITLSEASDRAREIMSAVDIDGHDPHAERRQPKPELLTVAKLIDDFLGRHVRTKLKPSTARQYEYRFDAYVRPEFGDLLATDVKKSDIIALGDAIAEEGKSERKSSGRGSKGGNRDGGARRLADGIVEIVSSMYGWAQKRDLLDYNPAFRVAKYGTAARRDRVLADAEVPIFWDGVVHPKVGEPLASILRLLLLTGQRRSEVAGACISEFNFSSKDPSWTIGRARTKNSLTHTVPLAPRALLMWREAIARFSDGEFVFAAGRAGFAGHIHPGSVTKAMRHVRAIFALDDLRAHDLRRTVRTRMAALRIPREISARVLNHVDEYERGVHDESYNRHEYFDEKLEALVKWEAELTNLLGLGGREFKSRRSDQQLQALSD